MSTFKMFKSWLMSLIQKGKIKWLMSTPWLAISSEYLWCDVSLVCSIVDDPYNELQLVRDWGVVIDWHFFCVYYSSSCSFFCLIKWRQLFLYLLGRPWLVGPLLTLSLPWRVNTLFAYLLYCYPLLCWMGLIKFEVDSFQMAIAEGERFCMLFGAFSLAFCFYICMRIQPLGLKNWCPSVES